MGRKPDITITSDYLNYVRNQIQKSNYNALPKRMFRRRRCGCTLSDGGSVAKLRDKNY